MVSEVNEFYILLWVTILISKGVLFTDSFGYTFNDKSYGSRRTGHNWVSHSPLITCPGMVPTFLVLK